jgi:cell division protein FtsW
MTTARPEDVRRRSLSQGAGSVRDAVRHTLAHPLANYYMLLGAAGLLLTIGVIMVFSASSVYSYVYLDDSYAIVRRQLVWVAIGLPVAFVASRMPVRWIRALAWPGFVVAVVLLVLTFFLGESRNGNQNWLPLGPVAIQPSEIAKLALVLWAAHVYALKERRLDRYSHLLVPVVPGMALFAGLVVLGRDLGTTLVFVVLMLGMLWVVGAPARLFLLSVIGLGSAVAALALLDNERLSRITNFADPFKEYHDAGWQPAHGLFALATGEVFGSGIGGSTQKWEDLPEAHTDFIFAVLGEELGLVGTLLVVGLFAVIAFAGIRVALQASEPFVRYATFGIVVWLIGQMMINVGMVLAVLPVIGIPLPLISYGGSALVPTLVALGLVIGFARREPEAAAVLASRRAGDTVEEPAEESTGGSAEDSAGDPAGTRA